MVLVIRKAQMSALEAVVPGEFEDGMVAHLRQHFPRHLELFGEQGMRDVIRVGQERAQVHDLATRPELYLYIDVMIMLGGGFDTDPQLPWAGRILGDRGAGDPRQRLDRLYETAMDYLDRVVGPGGVFPVSVYRRLQSLPWERARALWGTEELLPAAEVALRRLWPEKHLEMGRDGLVGLLERALEFAQERQLASNANVGIAAMLMFVFGHALDQDPLFTFVARMLGADEAKTFPEAALRSVYTETLNLIARGLIRP